MMCTASFRLILLVMSFSQARNICELMTEGKFFHITREKLLPDSQITKLSLSEKIRCLGACLSQRGCKSVNYKKKSKECHLNNRTVVSYSPDLNTNPEYDFFDIVEREAGACVKHTCPLDSHCDSVNATHQNGYATGCLESPAAEDGHFDDVPKESPIGTTLPLVCDPGYMPKGEMVCQDNGTWSSPECVSISSCSIVKQYQPTSGDGEYWLRLTNFQYTTKIYCHKMSTSSPEEFLTLPNINYGIYPNVMNHECYGETTLRYDCTGQGGEIWFHKIKVNITTMEVSKNDRTFANISNNGMYLYYGSAYDCYTEHHKHALLCGTKGRFTIDLRGTGWKVSENQQWEGEGWKPIIENIDRQMNGTLVQLRCGGFAGGCSPAGRRGVYLSPSP